MLNKQQQEVVNSRSNRILCLAGAGTGKTLTLIERVRRIADVTKDPSSILVLTFTNAAAAELRSRYQKDNNVIGFPEFRTFHSFCYSILTKDVFIRSKLGYKDVPEIADESEEKKILNKVKMALSIDISERKISGKDKLTKRDEFQYQILKKACKRSMIESNKITFDSLCYEICKLFVNKEKCVEKYIDRYKYIFVDEFQDTDRKQWEFVKSFENSDLFVVGDALQSIYSFRGADSSIIKSLAIDKNWTTYKLYQNYRSCNRICNYANEHTDYADTSYRLKIISDKDGGHVAESDNSSVNLLRCVLKCKEYGGKTAILSRTNKEVENIVNLLKEEGIEIDYNQKDNSTNIIKSCLDENYCMIWLASFLHSNEYSRFIKASAEKDYTLNKFIFDFSYNKRIKQYWEEITDIKQILDNDKEDHEEILAEVLGRLGLPTEIIDNSVDSRKDLIDFINEIKKIDKSSSIYVGTIHSVKGLEYDNVIISGVKGESFQLTNEENNNLYYVGCTRAKKNLFILRGDRFERIQEHRKTS